MSGAWIEPDWEAPPGVRALTTTRLGGVSEGPYAGFNLGAHVGDDPAAVAANRAGLRRAARLPCEPLWLRQCHGTAVAVAEKAGSEPEADAAVARTPGRVLAVLTADCLPVVLAAVDGRSIAIAHAGWRGLVSGVVEAALAAVAGRAAERIVAWLGPAIGPRHYLVGEDVLTAFADAPGAGEAFMPAAENGRWHCDLAALARARLAAAGVAEVRGGGRWCTYARPERFYSYRRDGRTGRMATLVWRVPCAGT